MITQGADNLLFIIIEMNKHNCTLDSQCTKMMIEFRRFEIRNFIACRDNDRSGYLLPDKVLLNDYRNITGLQAGQGPGSFSWFSFR